MVKARVKKSINAPAGFAWDKLSAFSGIEEFSPIEKSILYGQGEGAKRTCILPNGAEIFERLDRVDEDSMHMQYVITKGPFPVENYISNVRIKSLNADSCEISWDADYAVSEEAAPDMKNLFEGFYHAIIDGLENLSRN